MSSSKPHPTTGLLAVLGTVLNQSFGILWQKVRRTHPKWRTQQVVGFLAVVVIIASALSVTLSLRPRDPFANNRKSARLFGEALAMEVGKLAGGRRVVALVPDQNHFGNPLTPIHLESLQAAARASHFSLEIEEVWPSFSASQWNTLLRHHANAAVLIVFVPLPELSKEELAMLPHPRPALVGVGGVSSKMKELCERGVVQLAFVRRLTDPGNGNSSRAPFEHDYEIITAAKAMTP